MRSSGLGGAALLVLLTGAARGAPLSASFTVTRQPGAEDCPDAAALDAAVAHLLGAPASDVAARAAVQADVAFTRGALGYEATLRLRGAKQGERTLTDTGPTCAALGRAVGITMALLLDAPEDGAAPPPVVVAPAPRAAPKTAAFVSLTGGAALRVVGPASIVGGLELELGVGRRARLLAGGQYVAPRATAFDVGSVDVSLLAGRAGACGVLNDPLSAVHVSLCALVSGGQLRGAGSGFQTSKDATLTWLAFGGGLRAQTIVRGRWLLGAAADLEAPASKYTFSIEKVGTAFRSRPVVGMLQLGVGGLEIQGDVARLICPEKSPRLSSNGRGSNRSLMTMTLDEIYEKHADFVWRCLRRQGVAPDDASDAIQEVFLVVHRTLDGFQGRSSLPTWLLFLAICRSVQPMRIAGSAPTTATRCRRRPRCGSRTSIGARIAARRALRYPNARLSVAVSRRSSRRWTADPARASPALRDRGSDGRGDQPGARAAARDGVLAAAAGARSVQARGGAS